jgi:hypothetical protein
VRIGVVEIGVSHFGECLAERAEPGGAGEGREVGHPGAEVVPRLRGWLGTPGGGRPARPRAASDARPGAGPEFQVALAGKLSVRVHHDGPGDPQFAGQVTSGREPCAGT